MQGAPSIHVFSLCAIPGVGKSTLLKHLKDTQALNAYLPKNAKVIFVQEPVDEWRKHGWLQQFYQDPSQNAAAFQFLVFDSHVEALSAAIAAERAEACKMNVVSSETEAAPAAKPRDKKENQKDVATLVFLVERSFYCQRLFWQVQVDNGCASANALYNTAYTRLWSRWRSFIPEPSHMFFLYTTSLDETMRRVEQRDRAEEKESGLTKTYQAHLLAKHESWYTEPVARPLGCPTEGVPCTRICLDNQELDEAVEVIGKRIFATLSPPQSGGDKK